jgi:hypothetical protein
MKVDPFFNIDLIHSPKGTRRFNYIMINELLGRCVRAGKQVRIRRQEA